MSILDSTFISITFTPEEWRLLIHSIENYCRAKGPIWIRWQQWLSHSAQTREVEPDRLKVSLCGFNWQRLGAILGELCQTDNQQRRNQLRPSLTKIWETLHKREAQQQSQGDRLPLPTQLKVKVAGVTFENRQEVVKQLVVGEELRLRREPHNTYDPHAIAVLRVNGQAVGFIERSLAAQLAPAFDASQRLVPAVVVALLGGSEPYPRFGVEIKFLVPNPPSVTPKPPADHHPSPSRRSGLMTRLGDF